MADEPWRQVLARWWPRLLPGIAAGATHGVIRVGHAVRALLDQETAPRVIELGHGLAYWAARWQPLASPGTGPYLATDPRTALDAVPRVPEQRFGIRARLAQLADLPGWPAVAGAVSRGGEHAGEIAADEDAVLARLAGIVHAAVVRHGTHGYANPVMLVHAATAPNAILRTLPALPGTLWAASLAATWAATAAVTAAYAPATGRPAPPAAPDVDPAEVMRHAVDSAGPHTIKFADAALDAFASTGDTALLATSLRPNRPAVGEHPPTLHDALTRSSRSVPWDVEQTETPSPPAKMASRHQRPAEDIRSSARPPASPGSDVTFSDE
nr:hypothetical protein [Micromonospora sp. KC723]